MTNVSTQNRNYKTDGTATTRTLIKSRVFYWLEKTTKINQFLIRSNQALVFDEQGKTGNKEKHKDQREQQPRLTGSRGREEERPWGIFAIQSVLEAK